MTSSRPWMQIAICTLLALFCAVPLVISRIPPIVDYPFHLARVSILASWDATTYFHAFYRAESFLLPNVAFDSLVVPLASLVGIEAAGSIFMVCCFVLLLTGTSALHRALFGDSSLWPLAAACLLHNVILLYGFLNYVFGTGLMLWGLAIWVRLQQAPAPKRLLVGSTFALAIFFSHLVAFGLYALWIAASELHELATSRSRGWARTLGRTAVAVATLVPPVMLHFFMSETSEITASGFYFKWFQKLRSVPGTLTSGSFAADMLGVAVLGIALVLLRRNGTVTIAAKSKLPLIVLAIAYCASPSGTLDDKTHYIDARMPMAFFFLAAASCRVRTAGRVAGHVLLCLTGCYLVAKTILLSVEARQFRELIGSYTAAFDQMPRGSTLFVAHQADSRHAMRKMYHDRVASPPHVASLASVGREIFVPLMFALPGGHTLTTKPKYAAIKAFQSNDAILVRTAADLAAVATTCRRLVEDVAGGREGDRAVFLLIQDRASEPLPLPDAVHVVAAGPGFRLTRL